MYGRVGVHGADHDLELRSDSCSLVPARGTKECVIWARSVPSEGQGGGFNEVPRVRALLLWSRETRRERAKIKALGCDPDERCASRLLRRLEGCCAMRQLGKYSYSQRPGNRADSLGIESIPLPYPGWYREIRVVIEELSSHAIKCSGFDANLRTSAEPIIPCSPFETKTAIRTTIFTKQPLDTPPHDSLTGNETTVPANI